MCAALLAACASSAPPGGTVDRPDRPALDLRILPDGRVEIGDRILNFEAFVYELRLRCRAASGDPEQLPWLRIHFAPDADQRLGSVIKRLRSEAYDAGVLYMELEQG